MASALLQAFPGKPTYTEKDVPDLTGKVVVVTGANTGLGKEISQIVYAKNAKVYMMARSEEKTRQAMDSIRSAAPKSRGELIYIPLDLADLPTIKRTADQFASRERQLHVLFNNAGVAYPEAGSRTKQGYELQMGVNCLGTFALTKYLTPTLVATAAAPGSSPGSVRVVWVSSSAAEGTSPNNFVERAAAVEKASGIEKYFLSKLGNYLHAAEYAARHRADGVVSVAVNPGNLDSDLWRTQGPLMHWFLRKTVLNPPIYGAYTQLFAAFSPDVTLERTGSFLAPWGKFWNLGKAYLNATKPKSEGGSGAAQDFWSWTEAQIKPFQ